jgi:hypothetical protein
MLTFTDFKCCKPCAQKWNAPQDLFLFCSEKIVFLDLFDMCVVFVRLCCQFVVKIADVAMGESPKQG